MKPYAYYPGCSLESLGKNYQLSLMEVAKKLDISLNEIEDWNCCGATEYFPVDEFLAYTLSARNLAKAEKSGLDMVVPCSACYKNAYFTNSYLQKDPDLAEHINFALEADNLHVNATTRVIHPIELFSQDLGSNEIAAKVTKPLTGLKVAPYYGCQLIRPRKGDEDVENPQYFEELLRALGAEVVEYSAKTRCCGGSLMISNRKAALDMVYIIMKEASDLHVDVIATTCPMCNVNLELYQGHTNREYGSSFSIPVMYFTQLMGLALGVSPANLGVPRNFLSSIQERAKA